MDQMADEMTLRAVARGKGRVNTADESSWKREESEVQINDWRLGENEPGDTRKDRDAQRPRDCDSSSSTSSLFALETYRGRSASASSTTDSLSSSEQSNMGVDCAGIVLNFLFCSFYDMILMLPASCEKAAYNCCPNYKQVHRTAEPAPSSSDNSCMALDCGMLSSCQDVSDCLELSMEISEICYH